METFCSSTSDDIPRFQRSCHHLSMNNDLTLCGLIMPNGIRSRSTLVQVIVKTDAKHLPELILTYRQLNLEEHISVKFYLNFKSSNSTKPIWKCHLQNANLLTLSPKQNGWLFADDIFKCIFLNENDCVLIHILPIFVRKYLIDIISTLAHVIAWCWK